MTPFVAVLWSIMAGIPDPGSAAVPDSGMTLVGDPIHLRLTAEREWATFPKQPDASVLEVRFQLDDPERFRTLQWQQEDVRRSWTITLNGVEIGQLADDEAMMVGMADVPFGVLQKGENVLRIETVAPEPDDVRVGRISLLRPTRSELLNQAAVDLRIVDERGMPTAARATILDSEGALVLVSATPSNRHAIRTGVVYTTTGSASFRLQAGDYRVYAGKGATFEVDSAAVTLAPGSDTRLQLSVRESVVPDGYVSVDTHVHTLSWSGHGDASVAERLVTAAGEGVDALVLTEHNRHASLRDSAAALGQEAMLFIAGNEYTTPLGHFNVFPVDVARAAPDPAVESWSDVADRVAGAQIVVLNHGRDRHAGFAPLDPVRFLRISGERLDGTVLPANAMEIWNSSAQRSDPFELFADWLSMVNRGNVLVPIGSSDSHDVSRYLLAQGRTFVRCPSCKGNSDPEQALVEAIVNGRVAPSMGLVVEIEVDGAPANGEVVAVGDSMDVLARVWGPSWIAAEEVALFVNGRAVETRKVLDPGASGVKAEARWRMEGPRHDVSLVVLASGPAPDAPFWSIPKPYQRTSDVLNPALGGASGLVRVDADRDGRWTSPHAYARAVVDSSAGDFRALVESLGDFHSAVAVQAASILRAGGVDLALPGLAAALRGADAPTRRAFRAYYATAPAADDPKMNSSNGR